MLSGTSFRLPGGLRGLRVIGVSLRIKITDIVKLLKDKKLDFTQYRFLFKSLTIKSQFYFKRLIISLFLVKITILKSKISDNR